MKLLVVESPNKVKKIAGILGDGWIVEASVGHVRDLPHRELGIEGDGYELQYEYIPPKPIPGSPGKFFAGGEARVARIASKAAEAEVVYWLILPNPQKCKARLSMFNVAGVFEAVQVSELTEPLRLSPGLRATAPPCPSLPIDRELRPTR